METDAVIAYLALSNHILISQNEAVPRGVL